MQEVRRNIQKKKASVTRLRRQQRHKLSQRRIAVKGGGGFEGWVSRAFGKLHRAGDKNIWFKAAQAART